MLKLAFDVYDRSGDGLLDIAEVIALDTVTLLLPVTADCLMLYQLTVYAKLRAP
jgi:hypothetical protein